MTAATMKPPALPADLFIARFNCFTIQALPGQPVLMQVMTGEGATIDIQIDVATSELMAHALNAARARALVPPMPPLETTQAPAPHDPHDKGLITEAVDRVEDAGTLEFGTAAPAADAKLN